MPNTGPAWLQSEAGGERPGIDGVESEPVDELHDFGDGGGVIARGGHGEAIWRARADAVLVRT